MTDRDLIALAGLCGIVLLLMLSIVVYLVMVKLLNDQRKGGSRRGKRK